MVLERLRARIRRLPGVPQSRHVAERAVAPYLRADLHSLHQDFIVVADRVTVARADLDELRRAVADIESNMPAVLNAISSMNGASRMVKRQLDALGGDVDTQRQRHVEDVDSLHAEVKEGDLRVLGEMRPHIETLGWLMKRVETVRFEMLNELRYGRRPDGQASLDPKVVNPEALERSPLRLNIGAGHIPFDAYVNVDMRELPGIDVVATVDNLPFDAGTVDEIFSSHTLEHFPQEVLRRQLLPYWTSLLKPGGTLTTIAPDVHAMSEDYARGEMPFDEFREVLYGAQEYEGDTHFTGFTPTSFCDLLREAGLEEPVIVASDRRNGLCKEFEITARKAG
jgi:hypothetical protein